MRGHWESGTRRLNRHYQSGGKGTPSPIWQWGKYLTGGSALPYRFDHDPEWENEYQDLSCYYNKPYGSYLDIYGGSTSPSADYTKALAWEGPIAPRYDGIVMPGTMRDVSGTSDFARWYTEQILNRMRPKKDPDIPQSGFFTSSSYVHLYYDLGKRFVRFHCPKYGFGPGYNYAGSNLTPFYNIGKSEGPILTDVRIDAKACKMMSGVYSRKQEVIIRHTDDEETDYDDYWIMASAEDDVQGQNIYDYEQIGKSYVSMVRTVLWDIENHTYRDLDIRVYTFIYNGDLYLDLLPHFFDPDTGLEIPMSEWSGKWWVRTDSFPSVLMGFCHMEPYIQPTTNFDVYPSPIDRWDTGYRGSRNNYYPPFTYIDDVYNQVVLLESIEQLPPDGVAGEDMTFRALMGGTNLDNNSMRIFDVTESDFWLAESSWHSQHGGIPYLTGE